MSVEQMTFGDVVAEPRARRRQRRGISETGKK
jgi:hypothetical protein